MDREKSHYSDKGGHKDRSEFWKTARRIEGSYDPTRYVAGMHRLGFEFTTNGWQARRTMRRVTRDGR